MSAMLKFTTAPWVMGTAEENKESVSHSIRVLQICIQRQVQLIAQPLD